MRLNQTGTEDAQGTFSRIQEAVLKAGAGKSDEEKQTGYLEEINNNIREIKLWIDEKKGQVTQLAKPPLAHVVEGATPIAIAGGAAIGAVAGAIRQRLGQ